MAALSLALRGSLVLALPSARSQGCLAVVSGTLSPSALSAPVGTGRARRVSSEPQLLWTSCAQGSLSLPLVPSEDQPRTWRKSVFKTQLAQPLSAESLPWVHTPLSTIPNSRKLRKLQSFCKRWLTHMAET